MKPLYIISAILIAISALISAYLFANPVPQTILPHWVIPLISAICLAVLIGAERGPKAENPEKGFWAILLVTPILGLLFQFHYLSAEFTALSLFKSPLVPFTGFHVFLALVGNYVTTSKSMMSGLPTPWNLRSRESWRKSHRLGGYGTVIIAIMSGIATLVAGEFQDKLFGIGMVTLFLVFIVYSWWVWRSDPERKALFGTS